MIWTSPLRERQIALKRTSVVNSWHGSGRARGHVSDQPPRLEQPPASAASLSPLDGSRRPNGSRTKERAHEAGRQYSGWFAHFLPAARRADLPLDGGTRFRSALKPAETADATKRSLPGTTHIINHALLLEPTGDRGIDRIVDARIRRRVCYEVPSAASMMRSAT